MNVKARMLLESALDLGMLVRRVVVDDKMQLLVLRSRIVWNILTSVARGIGCSRGWGGCRLLGMAQGKRSGNSVRLNRCPEYDAPRALLEHGIAMIARVSQSEDLQLALTASQWLIEYAESLLNGKRQANGETASPLSPSGSPPWRVC